MMNIEETDERFMNLYREYHDKIVLGSDLSRIDPRKKCLVQLNDRTNTIPYSWMDDKGQKCTFIYNKAKGCLADPYNINEYNSQDFTTVSIPREMLMLKHDRSLQMNDVINWESNIRQWGFQVLGMAYAEKMLGMPSKINTGPREYLYHPETRSLSLSTGEGELFLDDLKKIQNGEGTFYQAYFNTHNAKLENLEQPWRLVYPGYELILLPEGKKLDPVGHAMKEGKSGFADLNENPIITWPLVHYRSRLQTGEDIPEGYLMDYQEMLVAKKQEFIHQVNRNEESPAARRISKLLETYLKASPKNRKPNQSNRL